MISDFPAIGLTRSIKNRELEEISNIVTLNLDEDFALLWYDDLIEDTLKTTLCDLTNNFVTCSNNEQFLHSIENAATSKLIIIIGGHLGKSSIPVIHDNIKIDSIFIFCMNSAAYQDVMNDSYSKILGIYTDYHELFTCLQRRIRIILDQLSTLHLYNMNQKSIRDLAWDPIGYRWYQLMRDFLIRLKKDGDGSKEALIDCCREKYKQNIRQLNYIQLFEDTYTFNDAISWYTRDCFLYHMVNEALRTEDFDGLIKLRYYIVDLSLNLRLKQQSNSIIQNSFKVYRGVYLSSNEIKLVQSNIGNFIAANAYLSTSKLRAVSEMFADNVIFEITVDVSYQKVVYADITNAAMNTDEEEILFDLGTTFQIMNVYHDGNHWVVLLTTIDLPLSNDDPLEANRVKFEETESTQSHILFTTYLIELGQYKKAIRYLTKYLEHNNNNIDNSTKSVIYSNLAQAYSMHTQYPLALKYLEMAFSLVSSDKEEAPYDLLIIAGYVHTQMGDDDLALLYLQQALRGINPTNHNHLTYLYYCIGRTYFMQSKYDEAFEYVDQSLRYYDDSCVRSASDLVPIYCLRMALYMVKNDVERSIKQAETLSTIFDTYLPTHHFNKVLTAMICGTHYGRVKQYDKCIDYLTHAIRLAQINSETTYPRFLMRNIFLFLGESYYRTDSLDLALVSYDLVLKLLQSSYDIAVVHRCIGEIYYCQNEFDTAIAHLQSALSTYDDPSCDVDHSETSLLVFQIGTCYIQTRKFDLAQSYLSQALSQYSEHFSTHPYITSIHGLLGYTFQRLGNFLLAIEYYQEVLKKPFEDKKFIAKTQQNIASCYGRNDQLEKAIEHYEASLELYETMDSNIATLHSTLAALYASTSRQHLAIGHFRKVLDYEELDMDTKISLYNELAQCYLAVEQHEEAFDMFNKYLDLSVSNEIEIYMVKLKIIGNIFIEKYLYDLALQHYTNRLNTPIELNNLALLQIHEWIAQIYMKQDDHVSVVEHLRTALSLLETIETDNKDETMAEYMEHIALSYLALKNYSKALEYLDKSLDIYEKLPKVDDTIRLDCYRNKALIHIKMEQYTDALLAYAQALSMIEKLKDPIEVATLYEEIGSCYAAKGDYNNALKIYLDSLEIHMSISNTYNTARKCAELNEIIAELYCESDIFTLAIDHSLRALSIYEEILPESNVTLANCYNSIGSYYGLQDEADAGIEFCQKALAIYEECSKTDSHLYVGHILHSLADLYYAKRNLLEARSFCQQSMNAAIQYSNVSVLALAYEVSGNLHFSSGEQTMAFDDYQKALHLLENNTKHYYLKHIKQIRQSLNCITEIEF